MKLDGIRITVGSRIWKPRPEAVYTSTSAGKGNDCCTYKYVYGTEPTCGVLLLVHGHWKIVEYSLYIVHSLCMNFETRARICKRLLSPESISARLGIDSWAYNVYKYGLWKKGKNSSVLRRLKMTLSALYCVVLVYSKHSYIVNITRLPSKLKTSCGNIS
jgi:hypothetical protein